MQPEHGESHAQFLQHVVIVIRCGSSEMKNKQTNSKSRDNRGGRGSKKFASENKELHAACTAAKVARCLRTILQELGFPPDGPTKLHEDNASTIKIVNATAVAREPTERSRHIDIQIFAIRDWKDAGDIVVEHVPGIINPSDDLTKPLGWVLHSRHARRLVGHCHPRWQTSQSLFSLQFFWPTHSIHWTRGECLCWRTRVTHDRRTVF